MTFMEHIKEVIGGLVTLVLVLCGWIWTRNERLHEATGKELVALRNYVKNVEADSVGKATIARVENDWKDDLGALREYFVRFEAKLDAREQRSWAARDELRKEVQNVALQVAAIRSDHPKGS